MAGGRDERVRELFFLESTGNPAEEGEVRRYSGDLLVFIDGQVKSLTASTPQSTDRAWRRHFLLMGG